jgi:hypothetical protein
LRFAEDCAIDYHDGVGAEHAFLRASLKNRESLFAGQALGAIPRSFAIERRFVDVGGLHREGDSGVAQ